MAKNINALDVGSNHLVHHGILGQRWGVRRFQNPDGSLTEKGKRRYAKISKRINKTNDSKKMKKLMNQTEATFSRFKGSQFENDLLNSLYGSKWIESNASLLNDAYAKYRPSHAEIDRYAKLASDITKRYGMIDVASRNIEYASYALNKLGSNLRGQ